MGCIFKKKWKDKKTGAIVEGDTLWIKYYRNGKPYQESTHSKREAVAKKLLRRREGEISKGELPGIVFDKIRFDEIAQDYLTDLRINKRKTVKKAEKYVECLKRFFGGVRVVEINTASIQKYIERKIEEEEGIANGTVNRYLSALRRMFSLARRSEKVSRVPYIPMLQESNVRKGFFEFNDFIALKEALPDYLKSVVSFAYHTGWRKEEILGLTWDKVDIKQGIIRLEPGETKNKKARTIYMNDDLKGEIHLLHGKRRLGCPFVFHHNGQRIKRFEKAWKTACIKVGLSEIKKDKEGKAIRTEKGKLVMVPTKIFHDFRRTAARNMVRSAIPERVAMMITGHKTRGVFERYNIGNDQDLREAAIKQQMFVDSQKNSEIVPVPVSVTSAPSASL